MCFSATQGQSRATETFDVHSVKTICRDRQGGGGGRAGAVEACGNVKKIREVGWGDVNGLYSKQKMLRLVKLNSEAVKLMIDNNIIIITIKLPYNVW